MKEEQMAQKVEVVLVDDIDGSTADETVTFALDGVSYEIDLSSKHAAELRESLARWIGHARRSGGRRTAGTRRRSSGGGRTTRSDSDASKIREWARENGYTVSERGRISAEIREAYEKANG